MHDVSKYILLMHLGFMKICNAMFGKFGFYEELQYYVWKEATKKKII